MDLRHTVLLYYNIWSFKLCLFDCKLINIFDQKLADLGPGQYELKSFVDDWKTEHRVRQGKFGKVEQHPRKGTERILCSTLSQCPKEEVRKEYQASTLSKQIYMLCLVFVEILSYCPVY